MRRSEEAKNKYRISTESERKTDMTISNTLDESLNNGPGVSDCMNIEQAKEIRDKGYEHTLARLKTPNLSYLSSCEISLTLNYSFPIPVRTKLRLENNGSTALKISSFAAQNWLVLYF